MEVVHEWCAVDLLLLVKLRRDVWAQAMSSRDAIVMALVLFVSSVCSIRSLVKEWLQDDSVNGSRAKVECQTVCTSD
jgi:hypothetical protein